MLTTRLNYIYTFLVFLLFAIPSYAQRPVGAELGSSTSVALQVGNASFTKAQLQGLFRRYVINDTATYQGLMNDVIKRQLLVQEAKRLGYDKNPNYLAEVSTYEQVMAQNYLVDSTEILRLTQEAYQRLNEEVEVAHILLYLPAHASAEQTAAVYSRLMELRNQAIQGNNFADLAKVNSDDKRTAEKGGYMGWYTGLQLVYPLENAAFSTPAGSISLPIRTKFGYHLIKVLQKRPFRGRLVVQHILKAIPSNATEQYKTLQRLRIDSLATVATSANFEELARKHSDDFVTKNKGGELQEFWTGSRQEAGFEEAAFALSEGQISPPIFTSSGWHLLKLKKRNLLPPYSQLKDELVRKVTTDSRGEHLEGVWHETALRMLGYRPNQSIIDFVKTLATNDLLTGNWKIPASNDARLTAYLFAIDGISVGVQEFLIYLQEQQNVEKVMPGYTASMQLQKIYEKFEKKKVKEFRDRNLSKVNTEFAQVKEEFSSSMLIQEVLQTQVLNKSTTDTAAVHNFYLQTKQRYLLPESAIVRIIETTDTAVLSTLKQILAEGSPYRMKRGIAPAYYIKNNAELNEEITNRLISLASFLNRNPQRVVEVGGHLDVNESEHISAERIRRVVEFLKQRGVALTQIRELDYGNSRPADRFDWSKNQRVTFQFYTYDFRELDKTYATPTKPVTIKEERLNRNQLAQQGIAWKLGETLRQKGLKQEWFQVLKLENSRPETYAEAKPKVMKQYQQLLETRLIQELSSKFAISVNEPEARAAFQAEKMWQQQ